MFLKKAVDPEKEKAKEVETQRLAEEAAAREAARIARSTGGWEHPTATAAYTAAHARVAADSESAIMAACGQGARLVGRPNRARAPRGWGGRPSLPARDPQHARR